jgi:hypothetical protein
MFVSEEPFDTCLGASAHLNWVHSIMTQKSRKLRSATLQFGQRIQLFQKLEFSWFIVAR